SDMTWAGNSAGSVLPDGMASSRKQHSRQNTPASALAVNRPTGSRSRKPALPRLGLLTSSLTESNVKLVECAFRRLVLPKNAGRSLSLTIEQIGEEPPMPSIDNVTWYSAAQQIVVSGSGFGSHAPYNG